MDRPSASDSVQKALDRFIKPREETAYIRRVIALHLLESQGLTPSQKRPLSLASKKTTTVDPESIVPGLYRNYLKALEANREALRDYDSVRKSNPLTSRNSITTCPSSPPPLLSSDDDVQQHLTAIELDKKLRRLRLLDQYLQELAQLPAASPAFLDLNDVFVTKSSSVLPLVPHEVVDRFAAEAEPLLKPNIKSLATQLEKISLQAKVTLQAEEQQLQDIKAQADPTVFRGDSIRKLHALNATRNELISWIETELSKSSGGDVDGEDFEDDRDSGEGHDDGEGGGGSGSSSTEQKMQALDRSKESLVAQLDHIKQAYAQYVASRKALLTVTSNPPIIPKITLPNEQTSSPSEATFQPLQTEALPKPEVPAYLLLPYLEALMYVSRQQKNSIVEKAHVSAVLAKQRSETSQMLDHLEEESQLLQRYSSSAASKPANVAAHKLGLADPRKKAKMLVGGGGAGGGHDPLSSLEKRDLTDRIKPWVAASDAAKIASLETVAEHIEQGQAALDGSIKALLEIDHLLGRDIPPQKVKLQPAQMGNKPSRISVVETRDNQERDIWSLIDGTLGLS